MSFRNQLVADSNYLRSMFETNFRVCMETDRRIRISATLQRIVYVVFAAFLALFIIYLAVSCSQKGDVRANTVITDYLYGVEYDDYDFDLCIKEYDKRMHPRLGGCSEVRNGNFIGRNLDWYINTDASAIIKVNAKSGTGFGDTRYASLGVVGCSVPFSNEVASSGEWNERAYTFLPFSTTDGINEKGLYVGVNVTATGETSFDKSTWKPFAWGLGAALTNDKSDKVYSVTYLVRIVLDHASSVADAKELIKSMMEWDTNAGMSSQRTMTWPLLQKEQPI